MKKNIFGRQLKRDVNERKALFKNLMTSLVLHDRIQTTEAKAKAIKSSVEKLVTKAKKKGVNATSELLPFLYKDAVKKMLNDIAPRFADRAGGYTRIIKLGHRFGDDASTVIMEWVEGNKKLEVDNSKKVQNNDKKIVDVKTSRVKSANVSKQSGKTEIKNEKKEKTMSRKGKRK